MSIRDIREAAAPGRHRRQWPRDVFVATALTLAALVLLGLTLVGDRSPRQQPVAASSTDVARK